MVPNCLPRATVSALSRVLVVKIALVWVNAGGAPTGIPGYKRAMTLAHTAIRAVVENDELEVPYTALPEDVERFARDGHVLLRGVLSPEAAARWLPPIARAVARLNDETRPIEERDTYGQAFLQTMNLWVKDAAVRRFSLARRFAGVAAALMGVPAVRMYHDQALFKEPGGGITPWHQDHYYWPLATDHTITMWMPLVDVTSEMGIMRFASGSHRDGLIEALEIGDRSEAELSKHVASRGFAVEGPAAMRAGDVTFHSGWTLHRAPPNVTDKLRPVMTVIYFADGTRVEEPDPTRNEGDLKAWLPGLKAGDPAASELNPVLFRR
jgi:Phytanoyl-CoA dioxygenase (PhyH)